MTKYLFFLFLLTLGFVKPLFSQIGGTQTYSFLTLPNSARIASLGGKVVSIVDNDINLAYYNPAILSDEMQNHLSMNYSDYFTDINYGYASYAFPKKDDNRGMWAAGIYFIHYGSFIEADEYGTILGQFSASEYALNVIYSRPFSDRIRIGVNLKPVLSYFERYSSYGLASDWGMYYMGKSQRFSSALVFRNLGLQLTSYNKESFNREQLPFEILAGLSFMPKHAPFRLSFTFHQLQKPNLTYESSLDEENETSFDPKEDELPEQYKYIPKSSEGMMFSEMFYTAQGFFNEYSDPFFRHLNVSVEFLPFDNFYVSLGYNHQRRQELKISNKRGLVGFSLGMGINIKKINISYGRASYHLAGATNNFSIRTDISRFYRSSLK